MLLKSIATMTIVTALVLHSGLMRADAITRAQISEPDAFALMNEINNSNISGLISLEDAGGVLTVTGFATGLDPLKVYVSLFYDTGSVPSGPLACRPTNQSLTFSQMVISYWLPLGSATRTLAAVKVGPPTSPVPLAYVPINQIGTVSIRQDTQPLMPIPAAPDPNRFQIKACGRVQPAL